MKRLGNVSRRGHVQVMFMLAFVGLLGFLSLCVDIGLRRLVDAELQSAADASAIAACQALMTMTPDTVNAASLRAAAIAAADGNATTRGQIRMQAGDVQIGRWDPSTRSFTICEPEKADAIRTTVTRTKARGNAVPTYLARVLGTNEMNSTRSAIARLEVPPDYALVGLDGFTSAGVLTVDGSPWTGQGHIASNGDVKLNLLGLIGVTVIDGHVATRGNVQLPLIALLTKIKNGIRRPDEPFVLPPVSLQQAESRNDNAKLGSLLSGSNDLNVLLAAELPAGTYCVDNFNVLAGAILTVKGPVTIYVKNNVNIIGTVLAWNSDPANFKIRAAGPGNVVIAANVTLSADIYSPKSDINIAAGVIYRGRLIGKRINILGTSLFYLRPDLPPPELGRPRVTLVR